MIETQVCIVGAGPAGLTTAMNLNKLGVDCVLVDKDKFPRDKVCGDSFNGMVYHVLNRLDPGYIQEMEDQNILLRSWHYSISDVNNHELVTSFDKTSTPRILSRRLDFDAFLMNKAKAMPHIKVLEEVDLISIDKNENGAILTSRDNKTQIKTQLIVAATGETSRFYNSVTQKAERDGEPLIYVRAYFKNVELNLTNEIRIHVFYNPMIGVYVSPLPGGLVTVELGLKQSIAKKYEVNLRDKMFELIQSEEPLKTIFKNAEIVGKPVGTSIQLSSKKAKRSGDRFLLVGSVAQSVHPLLGYGVGHAMQTGEIAADVIAEAINRQDFSAKFLKKYDRKVQKRLGSEILLNKMVAYIFDHPKTLLLLLFKIGGSLTGLLTAKGFSVGFLKPSFYIDYFKNKKARSLL